MTLLDKSLQLTDVQKAFGSASSTVTGGVFDCAGRSIVGGIQNNATNKLVSFSG